MFSGQTIDLQNANHNFIEFISFDAGILPHELGLLARYWDENPAKKAEVSSDQIYDDNLRQSSVSFIPENADSQWIYKRIGDLAAAVNRQAFGFDLSGFHETLQLARYGKGDFFDWHLDFGPGESSFRKLSVSVQLSDPDDYEGGDLEFMINQNVVSMPRTKGTIIIFPSFIMHRVTPITRGTRESLVAWIAGPPFR